MIDRHAPSCHRPLLRTVLFGLGLALVLLIGGPVAADQDGCADFAIPDPGPAVGEEIAGYQPATARFSVQLEDEVNRYRIFSFTLLPGAHRELEVIQGTPFATYSACAREGRLERLRNDRWIYHAPESPGIYSIYLREDGSKSTMRLNALVLRPYQGENRVLGYRIGSYQAVPLRDNPRYRRPPGLLITEKEDVNLWLTPHFQLRQFLCKQVGDFPKVVLVHERLLLKLELLLAKVNEEGIEARTFAILSGYRTPFYNAAIGNRTVYSRHLYGDAADVYVDEDGDGRLDDLNDNGREDVGDARVLARIVEDAYDEPWYQPYIGGLGLYGPKVHRGGFIHVDTRGFRARW